MKSKFETSPGCFRYETPEVTDFSVSGTSGLDLRISLGRDLSRVQVAAVVDRLNEFLQIAVKDAAELVPHAVAKEEEKSE